MGLIMDRRIIKTKDAIKTAYIELLKENNTSKITITKIAQKANIDRKTFYLHYDSTDDIMSEIIEDDLSDLTHMLNKNRLSIHPMDTTLILHHMNACIMKDIEFFQCIANRPDFELFSRKMKDILVQKSIQTLSESSNLSLIEITIYSKFFISGIIDIYSDWFRNKKVITLEELEKLANNVIHNGIQVLK